MDNLQGNGYDPIMTFSEREELVRRVRSAVNAERIVLFGSTARGGARPDSDVDILVVAKSDLPRFRRAAPIYAAVADLPFEVEAVCYTPDEVAEWSGVPESLVATAMREGVVIYEAEA